MRWLTRNPLIIASKHKNIIICTKEVIFMYFHLFLSYISKICDAPIEICFFVFVVLKGKLGNYFWFSNQNCLSWKNIILSKGEYENKQSWWLNTEWYLLNFLLRYWTITVLGLVFKQILNFINSIQCKKRYFNVIFF